MTQARARGLKAAVTCRGRDKQKNTAEQRHRCVQKTFGPERRDSQTPPSVTSSSVSRLARPAKPVLKPREGRLVRRPAQVRDGQRECREPAARANAARALPTLPRVLKAACDGRRRPRGSERQAGALGDGPGVRLTSDQEGCGGSPGANENVEPFVKAPASRSRVGLLSSTSISRQGLQMPRRVDPFLNRLSGLAHPPHLFLSRNTSWRCLDRCSASCSCRRTVADRSRY